MRVTYPAIQIFIEMKSSIFWQRNRMIERTLDSSRTKLIEELADWYIRFVSDDLAGALKLRSQAQKMFSNRIRQILRIPCQHFSDYRIWKRL